MSRATPFDAVVSTAPPRRRDVLAPERDVSRGRYGGERGRDAKRTHHDDRRRLRRFRPWHAVAGLAVVAVGTAGVVVASSRGSSSAVVTTSSAPPTTVTPTTTMSPESQLAKSLAATYHAVQTFTDGNSNFPVGTVRNFDIIFTTACVDTVCTMRSKGLYDVGAVISGEQVTIDATPTEPCPVASGVTGQITDIFHMVLRVTHTQNGTPDQLTGIIAVSSPDAAKCNTTNDPVASSIVLTRVA